VALAGALPLIGGAAWSRPPRASDVYNRSMVIDALSGLGSFDPNFTDPYGPLSSRYIAEIRQSGVTAINLTVSGVGNGPGKFEEAVKNIAYYEREIARFPDVFLKVRTARDLADAKAQGKLGVIYGFQDTSMLDGDLDRLDQFASLGVKIVQPVYNRRNLMGDGCLEPNNGGLSTLGRELIGKLNERRIMVDLSHAGSKVQSEAIELSKQACAITHSGCRSLADLPRNTRDEELRMLADRGGVMGIYFMPFLRPSGQPTAPDVIRHIEHALQIAGEDHVGIGTDGAVPAVVHLNEYRESQKSVFEERRKLGIAAPGESPDVMLLVPEYNSPRRLERLADDLLKRGHSTGRVEKILGGNFARLFREVWT
jgi:membrane dipeptidase